MIFTGRPSLFEVISKCSIGLKSPLLIAEAVELAAVGALPGDMVARHAPDIFLHAALADFEPAAAAPAEAESLAAAVTLLLGRSTPATFAGRSGGGHANLLARVTVFGNFSLPCCLGPSMLGSARRLESLAPFGADRT